MFFKVFDFIQGGYEFRIVILGAHKYTLANWHRKAESGVLAGAQNYNPELIAALDEIKDLKKQLKIAQEEREILKKATAYFANEEE